MTGIRADANSIIASGHVMRCITIAGELAARGEKVTFFVADEESKALFDAFAGNLPGAEAVVLGTDWRDMEGEVPRLIEELDKRDIDTLLVDSYQVTHAYFEKLSGVRSLAYMDDLGKEAYPVDMIINYSGFYRELNYEELYRGMNGRRGREMSFLMGLMYAPLRQQFRSDEDPVSAGGAMEHSSINILLTAGGGDTRGMLMPTLRSAADSGLVGTLPDGTVITWQVVVGSMVANADEISSFADGHEGITVHRNVTDMAGLMKKCDLAVTAAGTMLTECAAMHLPAVFYQVADNQKYNVEYWRSTGGMLFAGDVTGEDEERKAAVISAIADHVSKLAKKREMLTQMSTSLDGITDGRGAERIAIALLEL